MAWSNEDAPFPGEGPLADLSKRAGDPYAITNMSDLASFSFGLTGVNQPANYLWSYVLTGMFLFVCFITFSLNLNDRLKAHMRHLYAMATPGVDKQKYWETSENWYWRLAKKHLFYAPLWKHRHNREWQLSSAISMGTLPGRFHMILLVIYFAANVAYCLILPYDVAESAITIANLRGRSGTLACLNLIPTILFALRSNPLIWIMNTSYDTFNLFHRWAARITVLEAVVHTLAWAFNTYRAGKMERINNILATKPSYQWGMLGTVMFVALVISAWSPIRHAFYETFLTMHRIFVILALAGVYFHVDIHKLPQLPWMWGIISLYLFELAMRTYTIVRYNIKIGRNSVITVEALPAEACRVTVELARPWHAETGCHAHIFIPALAYWSSHPFSIAWTHPNDGHITTRDGDHTLPSNKDDIPLNEKQFEIEKAGKRRMTNKISFICRARTGLTRKLYEKAKAQEQLMGGTAPPIWKTWGAIEGPYGGHDKLDSYGTLVLFAGGVGITHQVNFMHEMILKNTEGTTAVQKILLVWSIPKFECLEWIATWMNEILPMEGRKAMLRVQIFITQPGPNFQQQRRDNQLNQTRSKSITLEAGRPNAQFIIDREIEHRCGAMAITVCGPGAFADSIRVAARNRVDCGSIDFIEEAFSY